MAELADALDLKSGSSECGFESHLGHGLSITETAGRNYRETRFTKLL